MNILTLDTETTINNKGHWADRNNKLVAVGFKHLSRETINRFIIDSAYIQSVVNEADIIVGFNIKFDLHWLKNYGIDFSNKRIWDCQIAEFLLENQSNPYPSLNQVCIKYGLEQKLDVVKEDYWSKGIDTDKIPTDILSEYLKQDVNLTEQVFLRQREEFKKQHPNLYRLFQLQCKDLLVLLEMEHNGTRFNTTEARKYAEELDNKMSELYNTIHNICGDVPINLNSNDHISAILYGGIITETISVPDGVFKTGKRAGQIRYKKQDKVTMFPRLIEPLERTETKKSKKLQAEGHRTEATLWEVNSDVLRKLNPKGKAKEIIDVLQEYSKLEKLKNTYLLGWSDLIDKMNWPEDMIHGNLNQCVAVTGRLSSTQPNMQNVDKLTKKYCESRYV